jgi:hypothetical protein
MKNLMKMLAISSLMLSIGNISAVTDIEFNDLKHEVDTLKKDFNMFKLTTTRELKVINIEIRRDFNQHDPYDSDREPAYEHEG